MFNWGLSEMVMVFLVALVVLGPERLPEVSKMLGQMVNQLKRFTRDAEKNLSLTELKQKLQKPYDFLEDNDHDRKP